MAEYPTSKVEKALARRGFSSAARPTWQEWLDRHDTVPASAIQAPEIIQGFTGSWAAQYALGAGQKTGNVPNTPAPVQRQATHLGQPGLPEINFRPYDWGTTRHGKYGPSLLGHPISFEVVGPTSKSPFLVHQWVLDPTGPEDVLTLDSCTYRSTVAVPEALPASLNTLQKIYNLQDGTGAATLPEEGLYLVVSLTGAPGHLTAGAVQGGVGDGLIGANGVGLPRQAISTPNTGTGQRAKFEVFRVKEVQDTALVLDGSKRISDFFTVPHPVGWTPIIRAVTLLKPVAARVVAVPGSGARGQEQAFALVPPEKALNSDLMPPFSTWQLTSSDPWLGYAAGVRGGDPADYAQDNVLPVPKAERQGSGHVQGMQGEGFANLPVGILRVYLDSTATFSTADEGKVVRIYGIQRANDATWATASTDGGTRIGDPEMDRLLGDWEIVSATAGAPNYYDLRMVAQVDPLTGVPFFGSTEYLHMSQVGMAPTTAVHLQWTLHDPISSLWTASYLSPDKLNSARLGHVLDPEWVKPTVKNIDLTDVEASPARPDRAIFGTAVTGTRMEDPGSLMDLGFRAVLFPAKASALDPNRLVPDFDNPICSNEVVLDPTSAEPQYIEVDYAAGLVYLSHPPVPGPGCQLVPDVTILTNASNPRGEVVFFASFVPFSREPGQRSPASRVTGGQSVAGTGSACAGVESADVYGPRLHWPLAAGQALTAGQDKEIKLAVALTALDLPPTGFVEVVEGSNVPVGAAAWLDAAGNRASTWGYSAVYYADPGNGGNTTLLKCFGGGPVGEVKNVTLAAPYTAVLRRDLVTPNKGDGSVGTDFQYDTTYGSNKRATALRFRNATLTPEPDGSLTVDTRDPVTDSHTELFSALFSSWVLSGGTMATALPTVGADLVFSELKVLIQGIRTVLPGQVHTAAVGGGPGSGYIYIDSAVPSCPVYADAAALPLPKGDDVLIGRYDFDAGGNVTGYQDLRQPLSDVDKRFDITVGAPTGFDNPGPAHFLTLADAVAYATEVMRPTIGSPGRARRIKVIGPTQEDNAKLPIKPQMTGLIIEGSARRTDGTDGDPVEITWTGDTAPALFDLSGCSGIVMRDLGFRYIYDSAPSAVPAERCFVTVLTGLLDEALFENIRVVGPVHGLLLCSGAAAGFQKVTFRNCQALDLTDFAVIADAAVTNSASLKVDGCFFTVQQSAGWELPVNLGILVGLATSADGWVIQDSFLAGGYKGIHSAGGAGRVLRTTLLGTDRTAIDLEGDRWLLDGVEVGLCHINATGIAGAPANGRVGISVRSGGEWNTVQSTKVTLLFPAVNTDYAFWMSAAGNKATLRDNDLRAKVQVGVGSLVEGNTILDYLSLGADSKATNNVISEVAATGDVQAGARCVLAGNVVDGNFNPVADALAINCHLTDNWFKGGVGDNNLASGAVCTGTQFDDAVYFTQGQFVNCQFGDGIHSAAATNSIFQGCLINYGADRTVVASTTQLLGCKVYSPGAAYEITFDGYQNVFEGNEFAVTLQVINSIALARDDTKVSGNIWKDTPSTGLHAAGDYLTIENNVIPGQETVTTTGYSIHCTGDNNLISGNQCGQGLLVAHAVNGKCLVRGNRVLGEALWSAKSTSYLANAVDGDMELSAAGTDCLIEDNYFGGSCDLLAVSLDFIGNLVMGGADTLTAGATYQRFKNNRVNIPTVVGLAAGATQDFIGNFFNATFTIVAGANTYLEFSTISDNVFGAAVDLNDAASVQSLATCTVTGNQFKATTDIKYANGVTVVGNTFYGAVTAASATNCNFSGNTFAGSFTLTSGTLNVIQGNHVVTADMTLTGSTDTDVVGNRIGGGNNLDISGGTDSVVSGNRVTGNLNVSGAAGAVVSGNRVGGTLTVANSTGAIVQGNYVTGAVTATGVDEYVFTGNRLGATTFDSGAGAANSGVIVGNRAASINNGDTKPTNNLVAIGNKVNNGTQLFDQALGTATSIDATRNITD